MSLILPRRFKAQPQYPAPLKDPGFWRLVDIQSLPPLGTAAASITRTLNGTAKLGTGRAGKCLDFVAAGDYLSYGDAPDLWLSTQTGMAVVESPAVFSELRAVIFSTNSSGVFASGFMVTVQDDGAVLVLKQDVVVMATTTKTVKLGGLSTIAWSYNNVSGLLRIVIDGVLESFTSAQTFNHGLVVRNAYYAGQTVQANPHRQYLFALSAECDRVSSSQLIDWSLNPWQIFKAPARRLWTTTAGGTTHDLVGANAAQENSASAAAITQSHALGGAASAQANAASTGAITQGGTLVADNVLQGNASSTGSITQAHALAANSATQGNTASTGAVTQGAQFSADPATQPNTAGTGAITQAHALTVAGSTQSQAASAASITQAHTLTGQGATQVNVAVSGAISTGVVHNLAASQSTQANTGSTSAITQAHVLVLAPSIQDNIAAASAIVQAHVLAALSVTQGNSASSGAITAGDNVLVSIVERTAIFRRSKSVTVRFN